MVSDRVLFSHHFLRYYAHRPQSIHVQSVIQCFWYIRSCASITVTSFRTLAGPQQALSSLALIPQRQRPASWVIANLLSVSRPCLFWRLHMGTATQRGVLCHLTSTQQTVSKVISVVSVPYSLYANDGLSCANITSYLSLNQLRDIRGVSACGLL